MFFSALLILSSCGRMHDFTFSSGNSNAQGQVNPVLTLTIPLPLIGIETGLTYKQVITASNSVNPNVPITLTNFSLTQGISGVTADFSACRGAILTGTSSCDIYLNYAGGSLGSVTAGSVVVAYQYADTTANVIAASTSLPINMAWTNGTAGSTTSFNYPQSAVQFVNTATLGPTRAYYTYTDPYGSATVQFAIRDATTLPSGLTFDYAQGEIGGTPTQTQGSNVIICLVKNKILTSKCLPLTINTKSALGITAPGSSPSCTSGGSGTDADPYVLNSATDFDQCLRAEPTKSFIMKNGIDLSSSGVFTPITSFSGTLNGNGYTLSNMVYNDPGTGLRGVALFRQVTSGAVIKNLKISNFDLHGVGNGFFVAALAGVAEDAVFSNIELDSINISGTAQIGGMIGQWKTTGVAFNYTYQGGSIDLCKGNQISLNSIDPNWSYTGGLVGMIDNNLMVRITRSSVRNLNITGGRNIIGGLVGASQTGINSLTGRPLASLSIDSSFTSGNLSGNAFLGGIIGAATAGDSLTNVGSTLHLNSTDSTYPGGGLVGCVGGNTANSALMFAISNSYFNGTFAGLGTFGTVMGDTSYKSWNGISIIGNSYYNNALGTSVQPSGNTSTVIGNYQGVSSASLLLPATFQFWNSPWTFDVTGPVMPY